ncbi:unnamed protein product (macronuclear) [Paramecium tetraurelia]|uniref:protein S-acyltransferase n=1 Tax=Paramecium tetraurelia TaxID=5888 RepID=A0BGG1_PARTE|nr:uncharacterized protein GSPATT00028663001 [Paramecium tetraurelia]CAK57628.1 unnamed protein product [Paramecium tetraurelia]|eukprot:XP_001425026.1 hypothetical protein (macronuclear) [Paramecium tetraurelia strain d4-2]
MNQIPSFTKTPDKYQSAFKSNNLEKIFQDFDSKQPSTQAFSIPSQIEQETIVPITNNDEQKDVNTQKQEEKSSQISKSEEKRRNNKLQPSLAIQVHSVQNEFISEQYSPGMSERNKITQSTRAVNKVLIEKRFNIFEYIRYCPICSIDQIARAKHCQSCNKCVSLLRSSLSLGWQLYWGKEQMRLLLKSTMRLLARCTIQNLIITILSQSSFQFTFLQQLLLCFQTYLSFLNLTTWEFYSWNKISYLQELQRRNGSPFSYGWRSNLSTYCRFKIPKLTIWEYNPERVYK